MWWPRFDVTGTGSDVTGTGSDWKGGSHVIWRGKPLTSHKKGDRGRRTAEERGRRVQSPFQASGEVLDSKKRRHVGKKDVLMADIVEQLNKSFNEALDPRSFDNPWHADDESSISLRRIQGRRNMGKRMETKLVVVSWLRARLSRMGAWIQGLDDSQVDNQASKCWKKGCFNGRQSF